MKNQRGFTLVEIIVVTLILSLAGLGIFGIFQIALKTLAGDKAREGAVAVLNEKMELVRNLPYDDVGTVGGVIAGSLAQSETVTRNNVIYSITAQVIYIDDDFDGTEGGMPDDPIASDYKKVNITVNWLTSFGQKSLTMITYVAPKGVETTAGGGTLRITSLDASGLTVAQADVHLVNNDVVPPIDTTLQTNNNGILNIPGLTPSQESYQITVSKNGYNSDSTCAIDPAGAACTDAEGNPLPTKPHASVIEGELTEVSFNIDLLANLNIRTLAQAIPEIWTVNTNGTGYNQDNVSLAECSNGHYVLTWRDYRQQNNPRIYAQKYSADRVQQWSQDLAVTTSNNQNNPDIVVNDWCHSFIVWQDDRNGNLDIYLDQYNSFGDEIWGGANKINTLADSADQTQPQIAINATSSVLYITWQDSRDDAADIYLQKFDLAGNQQWSPEVRVNVGLTGSQQNPVLGIDNNEYVYIAWQDNREGNDNVYLQKINQNGAPSWTGADKIATIENLGEQQNPDLAVDANNKYLYVVWQDNRQGNYQIYGQKLDFAGNRIWTSGDIRIDSAPEGTDAKNPKIALDDAGNLYIVWNDNRNGPDDIYGQKVDADGNKLLSSDVRINLETSGQQENPDLLVNINGRLVVTWQDDTAGNFDIKAAQFLAALGEPTSFGNVPITVTGAKRIGEDPIIYKYQQNFTTNAGGELNLTNMEWDSYSFTAGTGYTIQKAEPPMPVDVLPAANQTVNLFVTSP